jgi:transposase-like protein
LVIYIDGQRFAEHHILSAVGVDSEGHKHVLGIGSGATENAAAVKQLLTGLRERGLPTDRKYLFIIDGAKALRAAIEEVFGADQQVQRCRNHKIENVMNELPKEQQDQTPIGDLRSGLPRAARQNPDFDGRRAVSTVGR